MKPSLRPSRIPSKLADSIHQQLNMYALAATAAGVGMIALVKPAEGKIVYTPANVTLPPGQTYPLDLNQDGVADFNFYYGPDQCHGSQCAASLRVFPAAGNEVWGHHSAFALRAGVRVGLRGRFSSRASYMAKWFYSNNNGHATSKFSFPWANGGKGVKNRYLGLKFQIKGKTHFGWARLTVWTTRFVSTLTGYAYENIANKPIITGKTKGPDEVSGVDQANDVAFSLPMPQPATLGLLAMGWPGLPVWRREEHPVATQ